MNQRVSRFQPAASLVLAALLLASCTDAFIEPVKAEDSNIDNQLVLSGRVCTRPPDPAGFPVKVLFIVDKSGSMCITDPPGALSGGGICSGGVNALGKPGRVRALENLVAQFRAQRGANIQMAVVPFETNVKNIWPSGTASFAPLDGSLDAFITGLQSDLGKGTDYQGALAKAYEIVSADIDKVSRNNPAILPRTRYVVVFLTDGTPYPRCSATDGLPIDPQTGRTPYADPDHPDLIWEDLPADFCNVTNVQPDPNDPNQVVGFNGVGTDRNQNYQLFAKIDQLMELKQQYNVGDIRFHTVLLFSEAGVANLGIDLAHDLFGNYGPVYDANFPAAVKRIAAWVLTRMAERGNGIYQEFNNTDIASLNLGALDYSSMFSPNIMKSFIVQSLASVPGSEKREVDSDGDGLPDTEDNSFTFKTNPFVIDSDQDGFSDRFEELNQDHGFVPGNDPDSRGCLAAPGVVPQCTCADTDGDGLSECAEQYSKTHTGLADSDGDGIPDGLEARFGLDPLVANTSSVDTDGDGLSDLKEMAAGSDPTQRDGSFFIDEGYQYDVTAESQADGSVCYDFKVANLSLVTPPSRAGVRQGYNLFKLYFSETPESGVAADYGVWKAACAWAQYDPPGVRIPVGPELTLENQNFVRLDRLNTTAQYQSQCVGTPP